MGGKPVGSLSMVPAGQIIDFEKAELRKPPFQDGLYLWVKGQLPANGLDARLAPRIYHGRPEYWGIEVAAVARKRADNDDDRSRADGGDPLRFEQSVPLAGITGTRGVTVIGANRSERIDIDGEAF